MNSFHIIGILCLISFLITVVAISTPGWVVFYQKVTTDEPYYTTATTEVNINIWYVRTCVSSDDISVCLVKSFHDIAKISREKTGISLEALPMIASQVESTIGVAALLVATILIFINSGDTNRKVLGTVASYFLLIAGIMVAIPTGEIWHANAKMDDIADLVRSANVEFHIGVPYSLFVAALGTLMCFVAFFLLVIVMNRSEHEVSQPRGFVANQQPSYAPVMYNDPGSHSHQAYQMKPMSA